MNPSASLPSTYHDDGRDLLSAVLNTLCCGACGGCSWQAAVGHPDGHVCTQCGAKLSIHGRVLMMRRKSVATTGLAQWTMSQPWVVAIYERYWRPAVIYAAGSVTYAAELAFLDRWLSSTDDARIVDLCCGTGWHLRTFRRPGVVVGVDGSIPMLLRASRSALRARTNQVFVASDVMAFSVQEPFDSAVMFGALHLMSDVAATIQHVRSLVREDAIFAGLAICDPHLAPTESRRGKLGFSLLSPSGYEAALDRAGFQVQEMIHQRSVVMFAAKAIG